MTLPVAFINADGPERDGIVAPNDPNSLAGQFQLRCHALVDEIEHLGFAPHSWISLVNQLGALEAAKHLPAENQIMPVTESLVSQGHGELTVEHSLANPNRQALFTMTSEPWRKIASGGSRRGTRRSGAATPSS